MKNYLILLLFLCVNISFSQEYSSTGSRVSAKEARELIDQHNSARSEVGVSNIEWSSKLASVAQKYADYLASNSCSFRHSGNSQYGENLFWGSGRYYSALEASNSWYEEKELYSYTRVSNSNYHAVGHYTQMIWKNTTSVGVGVGKCSDGSYIYVANYYPPGNYIGQYPY
jgi:pathogenesis-related protein 1